MLRAIAQLKAVDPSMIGEVVGRELTTVINGGEPVVKTITDLTEHEEIVGEGEEGLTIEVSLVDIDNDKPPSRSDATVISGVFAENTKPLKPGEFGFRFETV